MKFLPSFCTSTYGVCAIGKFGKRHDPLTAPGFGRGDFGDDFFRINTRLFRSFSLALLTDLFGKLLNRSGGAGRRLYGRYGRYGRYRRC